MPHFFILNNKFWHKWSLTNKNLPQNDILSLNFTIPHSYFFFSPFFLFSPLFPPFFPFFFYFFMYIFLPQKSGADGADSLSQIASMWNPETKPYLYLNSRTNYASKNFTICFSIRKQIDISFVFEKQNISKNPRYLIVWDLLLYKFSVRSSTY